MQKRRSLMARYSRMYVDQFGRDLDASEVREIIMRMNWMLGGGECEWVEIGTTIKIRILRVCAKKPEDVVEAG